MTHIRTRVVVALAALSTALLLSACQGAADESNSAGTAKTEDTPLITEPPAGFGAPDVAFANAMILHDQQALTLAAMVPGHSTNPKLLALAAKISDQLTTEVSTLKVFTVQWNDDVDGRTSPTDAAPSGGRDDATMARLLALNGAEFATEWLQSMLELHAGAIQIAETEAATGKNVDAVAMAKRAITARQAEVDQMKALLAQPAP